MASLLSVRWLCRVAGPAALLIALACPGRVMAQDVAEENIIEKPLVTLSAASVDRILTDVKEVLDGVGRQDTVGVMDGYISSLLNDFKGMEREKPFGAMLFLKPGFVPQPVVVGFLPVKSIDDLKDSLEGVAPVVIEKIPGEVDRYEVIGPNGSPLFVHMSGGYAYLSNDESQLDLNLPVPADVVGALSEKYDMSVKVDVKSIPPGMKELFLGFLTNQAAAQMAQRDDEPTAVFEMRKARGERDMAVLRNMLVDGESLVFGLDVSSEKKKAVIDIMLDARPGSEFAKMMTTVATERSLFEAIAEREGPLTASMVSKFQPADIELGVKSLEAGRIWLNSTLADLEFDAEAPKNPAVERVAASLTRIVERGLLDGFVQVRGDKPGEFSVIGGFRVNGSESLNTGLADLVRIVQQKFQDNEALQAVEVNALTAGGVGLHRIVFPPDNDIERFFGRDAAAHFGAGRGAVWFAIGNGQALTEVESAMDEIRDNANRKPAGAPAPFRMTMRMTNWLKLVEKPNPEREGATKRYEWMNEAFNTENDLLKMEIRPTENGTRVRMTMEEGFLRIIGLNVAREENRPRRPRARDGNDAPGRPRDRKATPTKRPAAF